MDTKLKKSKAIVSLISFFLSMGILIATAIFGISFLMNYDYAMQQMSDLKQEDYQNTNAFRAELSQMLNHILHVMDTLSSSDTAAETELQDSVYSDSDGNRYYYFSDADDPFGLNADTARNLLYQIGTASNRTAYSNDTEHENLYEGDLPEGYNFRLIFDGKTVSIEKDGVAVDVYGDGFYRSDSGMWNVPGYENMAANPDYEDFRVCLVARQIPVEPVDGSSALYDIPQQGRETLLFLRIWSCIIAFSAILLVLAFLWRKERRELSRRIAAHTANLYFEWKLAFAILVLFLTTGFVSGSIPGNVVCFLLSLPGYYLIAIDLRYNRGSWRRNVISTMLRRRAEYRKTFEQKLPLERRLLERWDDFIKCEAITFSVGLVLSIFTVGLLAPVTIALMVYFAYRYGKLHRQLAQDLGRLTTQITSVQQGKNTAPLLLPQDSDLREAAHALNDIEHGVNTAVEERVKSERMKVELITNVSHDIKTPLTSIISYVDLLKQEETLPDHVKDYIKVLDEKSLRLKNMIQDIFDVSKAASGNMELQMEPLDLGKLVRQTLADMDEAVQASQLLFRVDIPDQPVTITADGGRLYRVFQNLISNALRYSLEGTRVFVSLTEADGFACVALKNISRYELDPNVDITERFVRGDAARTTAGSGLGLSIAKSFTEACGGEFSIQIDADLFTARVTFPLTPPSIALQKPSEA